MSKTLTQCRLKADDGTTVVSWIPTKLAVIGKRVTVDDDETVKFSVIETHDTMDEKYVKERSADYRTQRRASDV